MLELDLRDLDLLDAELLGCEVLGGAVEDAIQSGNRDENALTDAEFYARHPERKLYPDPKIQPSEKAAIKEWLSLRDTVVRPALAKAMSSPAGSSTSSSVSPPVAPVPGSNAALAEQTASTTKRNQIIAGVLGLLALLGIGIAATR